MSKHYLAAVIGLVLTSLGGPSLVAAQPAGPGPADRLIVVARSDADYDNLRAAVQRAGGTVINDMRDGGMLVVRADAAARAKVQATGLSKAIATDHIEQIVPNNAARADLNNSTKVRSRTAVGAAGSQAAAAAMDSAVKPDPSFSEPGLMWSIDRIDAPQAWDTTTGTPDVTVGVADTGLDFTHSDLAPRIANVVDFTRTENPPICSTFFPNPIDPTGPGIGDADLAAMFGGPELTDWNGHGSWIGGNIAAALNGSGVNGIAPNVKLVSLKISQWCGVAYDSTILDAFLYAGKHNIDVVNISSSGYLDLTDPNLAVIWGQYHAVVHKVRDQGTIIAASAGNEHVRIGPSGLVLSHGQLTTPGVAVADLFGQFEAPGGIPGVLDVSSTGNVVVPSSASCDSSTIGSPNDLNATCKPKSDSHQAAGQGMQNQLSYFSDYGPRIDVAAPGGARKFNLPAWDRGGTPGFPYTNTDLTTAFQDFSTTSNWALEIPCFTFSPSAGFPANQCYSTIQGTSMAAPHASATLALIASSNPAARNHPDRLEQILKNSARHISGNQTKVLDPRDKTPGDLSGVACPTAYCHLGGAAISDTEAYGSGLIDTQRAVNR